MKKWFLNFLFFASFSLANTSFLIKSSPYNFSLYSPREMNISFQLVSYDKIQDARLNGYLLAEELPSESVLSFSPDGTATFFYFDTFLRHYRGRKQLLSNKIENLLSLPPSFPPPKCLRDIYQLNVSSLCFNDYEDILWWTGEIIYKFTFPFPIKSLNLSSPDGSLTTTVGDWEWEKVGRAVHIYASKDGKNWLLMWKSSPPGGVTKVNAELPAPLVGAKSLFIKFVGQNNNVLFDLYITAKLDARSIMPLLRLKRGENRFQFFFKSTGKCILSFEDIVVRKPTRVYPKNIKVVVNNKAISLPKNIKVVVNNKAISLSFPLGASIQIEKEGDLIKGIKKLYIGNNEILDNEFPALPHLLVFTGRVEKIRDWKEYLRERAEKGEWVKRGNGKVEEWEIEECRYENWKKEGSSIVIHTRIKAGNIEGNLDWVFKPLEMNIGSHRYKGIGYRLIFNDIKFAGKLYQIKLEERAIWESGERLINQSWGDFREEKLDYLTPLYLPPAGYFAVTQPFLFLGGNQRAILSFFDEVVYASMEMEKEFDKLVVRSSVPLINGGTPLKCWLAVEGNFPDKWSILNEWTDVFDYLGDKYRSMFGLKRIEPQPTLLWPGYYDAFEKYKKEGKPELERSWLWRFSEEKLPTLEDLGIKVVYLAGGIWESDAEYPSSRYLEGSKCFGSGCAPWHLEISQALGGEEALAHLCKEAHKRGIKIVLWSTPAHLSNSSPLLLEHPEWVAQEASGIPVTWYPDVVGVSLFGGYFSYAMERYKSIRSLGVDGFWQDSFLTFGVLTDFSQPAPLSQLEKTILMQRAMREMGYNEIHIEGCGPFGLSSGGWGDGDPSFFSKIRGKEYGLYYYVADTAFDEKAYFRGIASKGILGIISLERLTNEDKKALSKINRAYNKVLPYMKRRRLLGEGESWTGVEWRNGKRMIVLFSFKSFNYKLPARARVEDITLDKPEETRRGQLLTKPWHIYLINLD